MKLFLETALKKNYAAVINKGNLVKLIEFNQADQIIPKIQELGVDFNEIDEIIVGTGPGSYTGVRLGVVVAESMAFALNIPVKGVSSLHIFGKKEGEAIVCDARASGFYVLEKEDPKVLSLEETKDLKNILTPEIETLPKKLARQDIVEAKPDWKRFSQIIDKIERKPIEILYLRKTQAEIEREK